MGKPSRFGLFRFRSPLLTKSIFLSFPPGTEMFQFSGLAATHLWIQCVLIRESRDQRLFDSYPRLFAVFHARHRLLTPRHPPCALSSLTTNIQYSPPSGISRSQPLIASVLDVATTLLSIGLPANGFFKVTIALDSSRLDKPEGPPRQRFITKRP